MRPDHFAAVLWDMDGTLVDTEPVWAEVQVEVVAEYGGVWTDELSHATTGQSNEFSTRMMIAQCPPQGLDVATVTREIVSRVVARVSSRDLPWQPGAQRLVASLRKAGIPQALVTASPPALVEPVLAHLPAGTFAAVVTGTEVVHGKPDPEPYLTAAARLGVDPRHCLAVEDSVPGSRSASAAGAMTIAVPSPHAVGDPTAHVRLPGLAEVDLDTLLEIWRSHR